MAMMLESMQITTTATNPITESSGSQQYIFGENRRHHQGGRDLAHHEADHTQGDGLLHDQTDNGAIFGADQFEDGNLTNLAEGQGVDDEGDNGRADNRKDHQEHADLFGRGGDQLADEDLLHLAAGVDRQALPAADRFRHFVRVMTRFNLHQNRVDVSGWCFAKR